MSINQNLQQKMRDHLTLLSKALNLTQEIAQKTELDNIDEIVSLSDSREKLVKIIFHLFTSIDRELNLISAEDLSRQLISDLRRWQEQMNLLVDSINEVDEKIIATLEQNKDNTSAQISQVFQSKENLKGYNLSNVKR